MRKHRFLWLVPVIVIGLPGVSLAEPPYTWVQVVERGMPNFNDYDVAQEAFMTSAPLHLSFLSGVHVVFVFVTHKGQTYGVYHHRDTSDVIGIARLDWDMSLPQGLRFYEFYVDEGLLNGDGLTGQFVYLEGTHRIFAALCQIADLANEARAHADCPQST